MAEEKLGSSWTKSLLRNCQDTLLLNSKVKEGKMKIKFAQNTVKRIVEELNQEVLPIVLLARGDTLIGGAPLQMEKSLWPEVIKESVELSGATEYIFISEAFAAQLPPDSENVQQIIAGTKHISDLPENERKDIVAILHVLSTGKTDGADATIITMPDGKRKIERWKLAKDLKGRMVIPAWKPEPAVVAAK
jgi:hypothetical protein